MNNLIIYEYGTHTYNIQFKDEFGNFSEVKSFEIKVEDPLTITNIPTVHTQLTKIARAIIGGGVFFITYQNNYTDFQFSASGSENNLITMYTLEIQYTLTHTGSNVKRKFSKNLEVPVSEINIKEHWEDVFNIITYTKNNKEDSPIQNAKYILTVHNNKGEKISKEGTLDIGIESRVAF